MGAKVDQGEGCWMVKGASPLKGARKPIDCGESGATLRFMIPVAALADEPSSFLLGPSLEQRPVEPLLQSLKHLGVETVSDEVGGRSFIKVQGGGIAGGKTIIPGDISSQFISGLMFACPLARDDTEIALTTPLESEVYIHMTREVLSNHGVEVAFSESPEQIHIPSGQTYTPCNHIITGDFSSAAFLLAAAAITLSDVVVKNLDYSNVQGDKAIVEILRKMGVHGKVCRNEISIEGSGGNLNAIDFDSMHTPDLVPVCAALACYANGTSKIRGVHRLRLKESDRLLSLHLELGKMGADISVDEHSLLVKGPCKLHGEKIDPHNDHRIAMACAVAALGAEGETVIYDAECVKKSYPGFFNDLSSLGVDVIGRKFDR